MKRLWRRLSLADQKLWKDKGTENYWIPYYEKDINAAMRQREGKTSSDDTTFSKGRK